MNKVLVVDDDKAVRDALCQTLELADMEAIGAGSFVEAKDRIEPAFAGVILSDIRMPGKDGFDLLGHARSVDPELPVILLTGEGDIPMAVRGMSEGAFDFLERPCASADLLRVLQKALKTRALVMENRRLKRMVETGDAASRLLFGQSAAARELRERVRRVARTDAEVLISGAPGTGISKVAEVIHLLSLRAAGPLVREAVAALTPERLSAAIERARDGSLFLDEVGALPPETQHALLARLELGADARVLAGSYLSLADEANNGRFSQDLYYKLDVVGVRIPALRERTEDIPVLFRHYVRIACEQADLPQPEITPAVINRIMAQDWPGNARALMNAAMRFSMGLWEGEDEAEPGLVAHLARVERSLRIEALRQSEGNATVAAQSLRLPRKTFYDKLAKHGLKAESYR